MLNCQFKMLSQNSSGATLPESELSQGPGTQGRWCSPPQESRFCSLQALVRLRKSRSVVLGLKAGHEGSHISQHSPL